MKKALRHQNAVSKVGLLTGLASFLSMTLFLYCALRAHVRWTNLINTPFRYICVNFSVWKMYGLRGSEGVKACLGVINVTDRKR